MNKTVKRVIGGGLVVAALVGLAIPKLNLGGAEKAMGSPAAQAPLLEVMGHVVAPSQLEERVLTTGTLLANEEVDLASEVSGKVTQILFREGSRVEKGQLLVKINDADLVAQRERILHRIRLAEARVERQKALLEKGGVSQEVYDETLSALNVLQAELDLNAAQIAKTEVRAPFNGVVGLRHVSEGSFISPQSRIATLRDLSSIKVDFSVPGKYAAVVRLGSEVSFSAAGLPQRYRAKVYAVEPGISENTRTLQARAVTTNREGLLRPGTFADIELIIAEQDSALTVPTMSVISELQGKKVLVVENGRVQPRTVQTGIRTESAVQIVQGLAPQDTVLVSGLQQVRPGMPVHVVLY